MEFQNVGASHILPGEDQKLKFQDPSLTASVEHTKAVKLQHCIFRPLQYIKAL
jgi:hypothetical protein